ncbi:hypothetical protein CcaverHIS002_0601740 [Cutaneotrichosporon cavernicola]|uniref:GOLD domain-containing protein n=1 Tax=Cutaneotrichosporon cavernicola TaxID=279322 RepID=A0AA48L5T9_9TREE|nr:uncharacterized protein CcaverHIS019_0501840 [Cutaneotrichosporon cavernicola]BEI85887.1 hypothetical protein CcaverHIS002_0601740 [Cutaneotrichosporon cavernicola]BEI92556.1 hypothetical protein CcaverHIS019_0501840 [Cutaneotrichosporon cavernicola]BEJ00329.1 hypothetical protein CcaverHIS631_0501860 [Cutaneotrichosporon cavernicola]
MVLRSALLALAVALVALFTPVHAVKFDLIAGGGGEHRDIWNFAPADTLVVITANVVPSTGMRVDLNVVDGSEHGRIYQSKKDLNGEYRAALTTHGDADLGVCFTNLIIGDTQGKNSRTVDLDIDIGAEAADYNAIANQESLSLMEVEMRKLEAVVREIVDELGYLQRREMKMRDTNESTNDRVKWFSIVITIGIVALGGWQLIHLRSFFKRKYLID